MIAGGGKGKKKKSYVLLVPIHMVSRYLAGLRAWHGAGLR